MPSDGMGQKHTAVVLIALFAEFQMGCARSFSPSEDIGETQRFLEAWKTNFLCFLQLWRQQSQSNPAGEMIIKSHNSKLKDLALQRKSSTLLKMYLPIFCICCFSVSLTEGWMQHTSTDDWLELFATAARGVANLVSYKIAKMPDNH